MSEEKAIKILNELATFDYVKLEDGDTAIETILDLYDKEKERNKKLERQIKIKNAYLTLINDIAYDYDGCNTVESLKDLIDELVKMNTQALKNDDWTVMYTDLGQTKNKNILQELLDKRSNTDE